MGHKKMLNQVKLQQWWQLDVLGELVRETSVLVLSSCVTLENVLNPSLIFFIHNVCVLGWRLNNMIPIVSLPTLNSDVLSYSGEIPHFRPSLDGRIIMLRVLYEIYAHIFSSLISQLKGYHRDELVRNWYFSPDKIFSLFPFLTEGSPKSLGVCFAHAVQMQRQA